MDPMFFYTMRARARDLFAVLPIVTALFLSGCHQVIKDPNDPRFIVAETKNWTITRAELSKEIALLVKLRHKTMADFDAATMPKVEAKVLNDIVVKKLILEQAGALHETDIDQEIETTFSDLKKQAPNEAAFEARLKDVGMNDSDLKTEIHDKILIEKFMQKEVLKDTEPSVTDIHTYYEKNKVHMVSPDMVRVSRIVILADDKIPAQEKLAKKKEIDAARDRVVKGEDFAQVATKISEDRASAEKGGDMGYVQKGQVGTGFDQVAFSTKVGTVSAVFEGPGNYQFLKVTEVVPSHVIPEAEAHDSIAHYLRQIKQGLATHFYTAKLVEKSGVIFHLANMNPGQAPSQHADAGGQSIPSGSESNSPPAMPQ